jgi:hypothetical protein
MRSRLAAFMLTTQPPSPNMQKPDRASPVGSCSQIFWDGKKKLRKLKESAKQKLRRKAEAEATHPGCTQESRSE